MREIERTEIVAATPPSPNREGLVVVGVSIGNPYFTAGNIERVLLFTEKRFRRCKIFIADASARHTFQALGYSTSDAVRKARLRGNNLRNKCEHAMRTLGIDSSTFVDWTKVVGSQAYRKHLETLAVLFSFNSAFRRDAEAATRSVLEKRSDLSEHAGSIEIGVRFLLEELAFLLASPEIYGEREVTYLYHQEWPVFQSLIRGEYEGTAPHPIWYHRFENGEHLIELDQDIAR